MARAYRWIRRVRGPAGGCPPVRARSRGTSQPAMTPRAWWLFAASSAIWGVPYLFIRVAVDAGVPPAFLAWARVALGAALLVPLALRRGALRGLEGRGGAIAGYAACEIAEIGRAH